MTELSTDPLTLGHVAISLIAVVSGLYVLWSLLLGRLPARANLVFLLFTVLTSATGFLFAQSGPQPTSGQVIGAVSLVLLAVALYALYGRGLAGGWRATFVVTAIIGLYLNVFVLVIQSFVKVPALHAIAPGNPPSGPVFGAAQGAVLLLFLAAGWLAVKRYHPGKT